MLNKNLILMFQDLLINKKNELKEKYNELVLEYTTQKCINELLYKSKEDVSFLADYIFELNKSDKENYNMILLKFLNIDEINTLYKECQNVHFMKLHNFDKKGVQQYENSKKIITNFCHKLFEFNLSRNYKYINISQIMEIKSYIKRINVVESLFNNGSLNSYIVDIDEIAYILEKAQISEKEKKDISFAIFDENNKFYFTEGDEEDVI